MVTRKTLDGKPYAGNTHAWFLCTGRNQYEAVRSIPADVRALFGRFGISEDELVWLA